MKPSERPESEKKRPHFVYTSSMNESLPEIQSVSRDPLSERAHVSYQNSPEKIFGNSARFYKALKDFQVSADPNVLKEELWASRKEITSLEKRLLEKAEEIRELRSAWRHDSEYQYSTDMRKSVTESDVDLRKMYENENLRTSLKIREVERNSQINEQAVNKCRHLIEYYIKKVIFDYEENHSRLLAKVNECENKVINFYQVIYDRKLQVLDQIKERNSDKFDKAREVQLILEEVATQKRENSRVKAAYEKELRHYEKSNADLVDELTRVKTKTEEFKGQTKTLSRENKLLHELNEEIEKENKKLKNANEHQSIKIIELKSLLFKAENGRQSVIKKIKNMGDKEEISNKIYEKYKYYKKKYKKLATDEKKIKACYIECEVNFI